MYVSRRSEFRDNAANKMTELTGESPIPTIVVSMVPEVLEFANSL